MICKFLQGADTRGQQCQLALQTDVHIPAAAILNAIGLSPKRAVLVPPVHESHPSTPTVVRAR